MRTYTPCLWQAWESFDIAQEASSTLEHEVALVCMWLWLFDAAMSGELE